MHIMFETDDIKKRVAAKLSSERKGAGWSLRKLASESGVSMSFIRYIEEGKSEPTFAVLLKLLHALGIDSVEFMNNLIPAEDDKKPRDLALEELRAALHHNYRQSCVLLHEVHFAAGNPARGLAAFDLMEAAVVRMTETIAAARKHFLPQKDNHD